ncbi:MAG: ABC transporter ATP-binding protein [Clostridia bacterium]|nr:ABC transporter ATP-binding protein [Clostridia bacterium]
MSHIVFKNFSFQYEAQTNPTLKNINLEIKQGEKILIAGPSGSGKSTLGHCINGLIPFSYHGKIDGELLINGKNYHETSIHDISGEIGTVLQDQDGQFVGLSVGEDVAFFYENHNVNQKDMFTGVKASLESVDMMAFIDETPHNLSGGQKQRVSLAGILTTNTGILLFDEPLANLDPVSAKHALELIDGIKKDKGSTIIIIEHRIEDVLLSGVDRVIVMEEGIIVADMHPDELLPTDILVNAGLREPLYVEALKAIGVTISPHDAISKIENIKVYKENVIQWFKNAKTQEVVERKTILKCERLDFRYYLDAPWVIKDVSFDIQKGELLAILGNNGAGKSTLLKLISGIIKQNKGDIILAGESLNEQTIKQRSRRIGYVMQNPNHMITKVKIFDEVAFGLRNAEVPEIEVEERVFEALKVCGLYKMRNWPVSALSYGQKKRVTIASILVMKPEIIILDEPTAGQDYRNYKEFMGFVNELRKSGVSVVIITHDMQLALEYADRAVVLSKGSVLRRAGVSEIMADKALMQQANLRATSLSDLAMLVGEEMESAFLSRYNYYMGGLNHE